ncbi:MAG: choice-of-anchor I family protein [Psychroserpens sp.]|uniref:choice-of-anchor I family protein n=1 Tax=Psychroserpens sp. TaxID=2020870 RepID=UPI003CC1C91C
MLDPSSDVNAGTNWIAATNLVGQDNGFDVLASPGSFTPNVNVLPQITFETTSYDIDEDGTSIDITIESSSISTSEISVDVNLITTFITATEGVDFSFTNQTFTILANDPNPIVITIPITDDTTAESDELFLLELSNPINATLGNDSITSVYILDNDTSAPVASNALDINYLTSYLVDGSGSAEISAHDPASQRLFVLNSTGAAIEVLDFSNLNAINTIAAIDLSTLGTDGPTSVATNNGLVVAAISNGETANGVVAFMDINGDNISTVTVGNLPDMVTFTPDGTKVLVANEGQPSDDYVLDPEGSITVIDVTGGLGNITQANVTQLNFNAFDTDIAALRTEGVRIFGPGSSVSQDLEPEFITVSSDSQIAWVSLQENNAIAVVDLTTNTITDILPLGLKDHSLTGNTLDASDETDFIFFGNWPVKGMYMPDAIASYDVGGITYLVTANEGDAREYGTFQEEAKISDNEVTLDPSVFPELDVLALESNIGELTVSNATGDLDNDGDLDEIHVFGARSFSIWNTVTGALVYDSGDDFERITAADPIYGALFNVSNSNNNFKNRSDNKGPEPEGVTISEINGATYAFITLERIGGFMTYNISDPSNPTFESYVNNRDLGNDEGGDLGPEGIIYIAPQDNSIGTGLIVLANEVSSTISVYQLGNDTLGIDNATLTDTSFAVYPNPISANQTLFFNKQVDVSLFDIHGREITAKKAALTIKTPSLSSGTYILKTKTGEHTKIIIK